MNVGDDDLSTVYFQTGDICTIYLSYDRPYYIGAIRFFVPYSVVNPSAIYNLLSFSGTLDSDHQAGTYTSISTLANNVQNGWNTIRLSSPVGPYKIIKINHGSVGTAQTSNCQFAEIDAYGYPTGLTPITDTNKDDFSTKAILSFNDQFSYQIDNMIHYKLPKTPTVTAVSPKYGSWKVTSTVTITGTGFGTVLADASVTIDNIACTVTAVTDTSITCTAPLQSS